MSLDNFINSDGLEDSIKNSLKFDQIINMITTMVYSGVPDSQLPMHKLIPYLNKENVVRVSIALHTLHKLNPDEAILVSEEHHAMHMQMLREATERARANQPGKNEEFLDSVKDILKQEGDKDEPNKEGEDI